MNFLAHIYLSGDNEFRRIGNFMADGIRGKDYERYPAQIKEGILLHRAIDSFTDMHPVFRKGTQRLHEKYHHYAGVIMDVFYDHFLAKNWTLYSDEPLATYIQNFYDSLDRNIELLTPRAKQMLPVMKKYDWLLSYATVDGISNILTNMDRRTVNRSKMGLAAEDLTKYYDLFEEEFVSFFEDIRLMAAQKIKELQNPS